MYLLARLSKGLLEPSAGRAEQSWGLAQIQSGDSQSQLTSRSRKVVEEFIINRRLGLGGFFSVAQIPRRSGGGKGMYPLDSLGSHPCSPARTVCTKQAQLGASLGQMVLASLSGERSCAGEGGGSLWSSITTAPELPLGIAYG